MVDRAQAINKNLTKSFEREHFFFGLENHASHSIDLDQEMPIRSFHKTALCLV